jgi:hypothetical protein
MGSYVQYQQSIEECLLSLKQRLVDFYFKKSVFVTFDRVMRIANGSVFRLQVVSE